VLGFLFDEDGDEDDVVEDDNDVDADDREVRFT
jgi:hypothetical protein